MEKMNLENLYIEEIKFDQSEGGVGCGPIEGQFVESLKLIDGNKNTFYLLLTEFQSFCNYMLSNEDHFEEFLNDSSENIDHLLEIQDKTLIHELGGVELPSEYPDLFENMYSKKLENTVAGKLIRYAILLMTCEYNDLQKYIGLGQGHFIKEMEFPLSSDEEEYLEDNK